MGFLQGGLTGTGCRLLRFIPRPSKYRTPVHGFPGDIATVHCAGLILSLYRSHCRHRHLLRLRFFRAERCRWWSISVNISPENRPGLAGWGIMALFVPRVRPAGRGRAPSPAPTPPGDSHHGPLPGEQGFSCVQPLALSHERSPLLRDLPRDPRQNPQNKVKCSTSAPFHLILSMQYRLSRSRAKP